MTTINRLTFLKTAGLATGAAAISASPALGAAIDPGAVETAPSGPLSDEAVIAVIRDASRGEVTVLSGTTEKTYVDRQLVKRLLRAAGHNHGGHGARGVA
jgi:hypothetical protein